MARGHRVREQERARAMFGISENNGLARTSPTAPQRSGQTELIISHGRLEADRQVRAIVLTQASGAIE
jgi:hypothetical protein